MNVPPLATSTVCVCAGADEVPDGEAELVGVAELD
jgi:hypothetical protein